MTATEFQAMMYARKVSGTGERELKKHLSSHLGTGFCPTRRSVNMLSEGHSVVHYGSGEFTFEGKDNARAGDKGHGNRNKKRRTKVWGETKAVVAIHTSLQLLKLHDPTPPLQNRNRKSNFREIARNYLHQTGMRMRQCFLTVQNPLVRALAREKADFCNAHPVVIANVEATNKRNKRKFVSEKKVDVIGTRRKRQRDIGRFEAMQYFDGNKDTTLMWLALLFSNNKGPTGGGNTNSTENECHRQKELTCGNEM